MQGHVALAVSNDVENLAVLDAAGPTGEQGRRRREAPENDRPVPPARRAMAGQAKIRIDESAPLERLLIFPGIRIEEFFSCAHGILRGCLVVQRQETARDRAGNGWLKGFSVLEIGIRRKRIIRNRTNHFRQKFQVGP